MSLWLDYESENKHGDVAKRGDPSALRAVEKSGRCNSQRLSELLSWLAVIVKAPT